MLLPMPNVHLIDYQNAIFGKIGRIASDEVTPSLSS